MYNYMYITLYNYIKSKWIGKTLISPTLGRTCRTTCVCKSVSTPWTHLTRHSLSGFFVCHWRSVPRSKHGIWVYWIMFIHTNHGNHGNLDIFRENKSPLLDWEPSRIWVYLIQLLTMAHMLITDTWWPLFPWALGRRWKIMWFPTDLKLDRKTCLVPN